MFAAEHNTNADWCNGSTADSDSVSRGSSPLSVVPWQGRRMYTIHPVLFFGVWLSLVERYVRDVEVASSNLVFPIQIKQLTDCFSADTFDILISL